MALTEKLTAIADALRGKTGKTEGLTLEQMASEIAGMEIGGGGDIGLEDGLVTRSLTEYTNDRVTTIGGYAFYAMQSLRRASFPNVETITGSNNFSGCTALENINFPKLREATSTTNVFRNCGFTEISLPQYGGSFPNISSCSNLEKVDVKSWTEANNGTFSNCPNLKIFIIRDKEKVCPLSNIGAVSNTPFAEGGTGGTVYVPQALIPEYRQATNWSTLYAAGTCNFAAIEGSEYE